MRRALVLPWLSLTLSCSTPEPECAAAPRIGPEPPEAWNVYEEEYSVCVHAGDDACPEADSSDAEAMTEDVIGGDTTDGCGWGGADVRCGPWRNDAGECCYNLALTDVWCY